MSELVYTRNQWANLLPLCRSIALFGSKAHHSTYRVGSRLAQCTPFSTTRRALVRMAQEERVALRALVETGEKHFMTVMDNVQVYARHWKRHMGGESRMITGTGGTAVEMEDCPDGAFNLQPILDLYARRDREGLTVEELADDIDFNHLQKIASYHWLAALVSYVPDLAGYRTPVANLFKEKAVKHQINPHRHTKIHPLGTNSAQEITPHGAKDAIVDFLAQTGIEEATARGEISFFTGDGLTFANINKVKSYLSSKPGNFKSFRFIRGVLEIWHTKWTDLSRICRGTWGTGCPSDPSTLGYMARAIDSPTPSDLGKVDFYTNARLLNITVRGHMLHCWE